MAFMSHHLIKFTREALAGEQNASFYSTKARDEEEAREAARERSAAVAGVVRRASEGIDDRPSSVEIAGVTKVLLPPHHPRRWRCRSFSAARPAGPQKARRTLATDASRSLRGGAAARGIDQRSVPPMV